MCFKRLLRLLACDSECYEAVNRYLLDNWDGIRELPEEERQGTIQDQVGSPVVICMRG